MYIKIRVKKEIEIVEAFESLAQSKFVCRTSRAQIFSIWIRFSSLKRLKKGIKLTIKCLGNILTYESSRAYWCGFSLSSEVFVKFDASIWVICCAAS